MTDEMEVREIVSALLREHGEQFIGLSIPDSDIEPFARQIAETALQAVRALRPAGEPVAWQNGEREIFVTWLPKLIATLGTKTAHVDDVARLERLHSLLASPIIDAKVAGDDALRAAAIAGWNACRKSIYAVCEDVQNQAADPNKVSLAGTPDQKMHEKGFWLGYSDAGKSIARGFGAMEALDDDNLTAALRALATPAAANASEGDGQPPKLDDAYRDALAAAEVFYDAASYEETLWTGWGEQTVPASAEMRRVKAKQALTALRDADPRLAAAPASPDTKEQGRG